MTLSLSRVMSSTLTSVSWQWRHTNHPSRPVTKRITPLKYLMLHRVNRSPGCGYRCQPFKSRDVKNSSDACVQANPLSLESPLKSSSPTSRKLLSQFSSCRGWRWFEVSNNFKENCHIIIFFKHTENIRSSSSSKSLLYVTFRHNMSFKWHSNTIKTL